MLLVKLFFNSLYLPLYADIFKFFPINLPYSIRVNNIRKII